MAKKAKSKKPATLPRAINHPDLERSALQNLLALAINHPTEMPGALDGVKTNAFTVPEAEHILAALAILAAPANEPLRTESGVVAAIRAGVQSEGRELANSPENDILAAARAGGYASAHVFTANVSSCLEKVNAAYDDRTRMAGAIDTLNELGVSINGDNGKTVVRIPGKSQNRVAKLNGRVAILVDPAHEDIVTDEAEKALAPHFFVHAGQVVAIEADSDGVQRIRPVTKEGIRDALSRLCIFNRITFNENGLAQPTPGACPERLPQTLVRKGRWPYLRHVAGLASGPFIRPDGTVAGIKPGYDEQTKIFVLGDSEYPEFSKPVTLEIANNARDTLLDLIKDFPFDAGMPGGIPAGKAVWLAELLTIIGRPTFSGPAPAFCHDGTNKGSGKTLLSVVAGLIAMGYEPAATMMPTSSEELRKLAFSAALEGERYVLFDNVTGRLGGGVFDGILTATSLKDRVLNYSRTATVENKIVFVCTGNNMNIAGDASRRVLMLRLRPPHERWHREKFDRKLVPHVTANRRKLFVAALNLLRWSVNGGGAKYEPTRLGSFESWSGVIGRAVLAATGIDVVISQDAAEASDARSVGLEALAEAWHKWNPRFEGTAAAMLRAVITDAAGLDPAAEAFLDLLSEIAAPTNSDRPTSKLLGYKLRDVVGRPLGGMTIEKAGKAKAGTAYRLAGSPAGIGDEPPVETEHDSVIF